MVAGTQPATWPPCMPCAAWWHACHVVHQAWCLDLVLQLLLFDAWPNLTRLVHRKHNHPHLACCVTTHSADRPPMSFDADVGRGWLYCHTCPLLSCFAAMLGWAGLQWLGWLFDHANISPPGLLLFRSSSAADGFGGSRFASWPSNSVCPPGPSALHLLCWSWLCAELALRGAVSSFFKEPEVDCSHGAICLA